MNQEGNVSPYHIQEYSTVALLDKFDYGMNWDKEPFWFVWNRIFMSDIIKKNNILFDTSLNAGGEDVLFVIEYLTKIDCKMIYIPKSCYYWIDNDGNSASRTCNPNLYQKLRKTYQARKKIMPDNFKQDFYNKEFYMIFHDVIINALSQDDREILRTVLKDKVFREILLRCDLMTASLKLKSLLFLGNYALLKKTIDK